MFSDLLECLLKEQEESSKLEWVKRNPFIIVHNPLFYVGAWYYELGTGRFDYTKNKEGHSEIWKTDLDKTKSIRGRVCNYEGIIICVVYLDSNNIHELSKSNLFDIKYRCEQFFNLKIGYVLGDYGNKAEVLLEYCLLEDKKIIFMKNITRDIVRKNPDKIFLFGDNLEGRGFGGQAKEMRGEPNTIGIPTKKKPTNEEDAFFTDNEFEYNKQYIKAAINKIPEGSIVVIPEAGLGTGLAELPKRAPKTFDYLNKKLGI